LYLVACILYLYFMMKILSVKKIHLEKIISEAVKALKNGGVIVYPTETAYGLGADFLNSKAVKKIYKIKGRNFNKPLSAIVSSLAMAGKLIRFDKISLKLAKKHWPGPLTLVLQSKEKSGKYIGLRVSSNKLAMAIVKRMNRPLVATSANISGKKECYSVDEVIKQFKNKKYQPDLIIDAGRLTKNKVSTVVKINRKEIEVLRKGKIMIKHQITNNKFQTNIKSKILNV
jgi:L-threonylcarbamoyladenylate synthase